MKGMKRIYLTLVTIFIILGSTSAQYDDRFYSPSKSWQEISGLQFESFTFETDSLQLHGMLFQPEVEAEAFILFYHGSGGNISSNAGMARLLTHAGYRVFMIDFRGYGKSDGTPTHLNIAKDAQLVMDKLREQQVFEELPLLIYGASMGTQIATKMARDNEELVNGLVLDGTISSFTDMALLSAPPAQHEMIRQYVKSPYAAKWDIKACKGMPKLFIHSKEDKSVPFYQAKEVFENASNPKEFWIYEGGHLQAAAKHSEMLCQKLDTLVSQIIEKKAKKQQTKNRFHDSQRDSETSSE